MFPKIDMTRNANTLGDGIPTTITFLFHAMAKKATKANMGLEFGVFMWLKKYKTSTTKDFEGIVIRRSVIKTLKGRDITNDRGRKMIDNIDSSKSSFTLSTLRTRGRDKHSSNRVKNVAMLPFGTTILLRGAWA